MNRNRRGAVDEAGKERMLPRRNGVSTDGHDNRNRGRHTLGGLCCRGALGHDNVDLALHELTCEVGKTLDDVRRPAMLDGDVCSFDVAGLAEACPRRRGRA